MQLPRLYAIVDEQVAAQHGWAVPDLARAYLAAGVRLLQVRVKQAGSGTLLVWVDAIVAAARPAGAIVVVNDRADVMRLAGASGVHVGQDDLPVELVRRLVGEEALVGLSTHTVEQIEAAARLPISYLAVGPVFDTATKDTGYRAVGLDLVREAVRRARGRPVVAIGGITLDRAAAVLEAGAASVAVISDLMTGGDPERRARAWLSALG
jgi:thiamine-phosphate pyrophosphorylase